MTFILEAADDIAYKTADIEDAFVKGFVSYAKLYLSLIHIFSGGIFMLLIAAPLLTMRS